MGKLKLNQSVSSVVREHMFLELKMSLNDLRYISVSWNMWNQTTELTANMVQIEKCPRLTAHIQRECNHD